MRVETVRSIEEIQGGVIEPTISEWVAPVLIDQKKVGKLRF